MTLRTRNSTHALIAACVMVFAALAASAYAYAQAGKAKYVSVISLSDQNGQVRVKILVQGDKMSFTDGAGHPLKVNAESQKDPLAPVDQLRTDDEKADSLDQKSIAVLQGQIDRISAKVKELTTRVNELSTR
jgi:hypothetical protein